MKIYVITKGHYSDYHIITATTDEKLAYKIKEKFSGNDGYDEADIEVFEDAELFLKPCYFMRFDNGGNVIKFEELKSEYWYDQESGIDVKGNFYTSVITDNAEKAIKIGAERRAMWLAQENGL